MVDLPDDMHGAGMRRDAGCRVHKFCPSQRVLTSGFALALLLLVLLTPASLRADQLVAGAETVGGAGGKVVLVTNLDDAGPGSLRAALEIREPRIIRFSVGGTIRLATDLIIKYPKVTIEGETAPSPGITLRGATLRIKISDVILRHIRVRVGDGAGPSPDDRDAIAILGSPQGTRTVHNILIDHCSVAWAIDEAISTQFTPVGRITIRNSIIAETLDHSLHTKGGHSTGLLLGGGTEQVLIQRNLFAHNRYRNPVLTDGVSAVVLNNVIYNPGNNAVHFYGKPAGAPTLATIVGNVVIKGRSSKPYLDMFGQQGLTKNSSIYLQDNITDGLVTFQKDSPGSRGLGVNPYVDKPPVLWPNTVAAIPANIALKEVLGDVGARPWDRDATDKRIVAEVTARSGVIRDTPPVGEW